MEVKINGKKYSIQIKRIETDIPNVYDILAICGKHKRRFCSVPKIFIRKYEKQLVEKIKLDIISENL